MAEFARFYRHRRGLIIRTVAVLGGVFLTNMPGIVVAAEAPLAQVDARRSEECGSGPDGVRLERPGSREFILDCADLITPPDERRIRQIATTLLSDKATPIVVVTIESIAKYGGTGDTIEMFARRLFDQWGIGHVRLDGQPWNTGILLLVSRDDRKARIELGAGWKHDQDVAAQRIMDEQIVPRFLQGDFTGGIIAGVEALDKMARHLALPAAPRPRWQYLLAAIAVWGVLFSFVVHAVDTYRRRHTSSGGGGGGGFSGGSFGGGYSGGGGATGSW